MPSPTVTAYWFVDPGCPFGYSSRPIAARLRWRFGDQLTWRLVLIGLSESADEYVARGFTPANISGSWPGLQERFGMPFGRVVKPRLAGTSRACRAVVATRLADRALEWQALRALQLMQFTTPGVLDDDGDLAAALDRIPGLDGAAIAGRLDDADVLEAYEVDRALARTAAGSPGHAQGRHSVIDGVVRYSAGSMAFEHADGRRAEVGGLQAYEGYDTALANLDSSLERRGAPGDAAEVLAEFPEGLTTAEVSSVMRRGDLAEEDRRGTATQLLALANDGEIACDPAGADAVWRSRA